MLDFENVKQPKINKKKMIILIVICVLLILTIAIASVYICNSNFREWMDVNILRKEIKGDSVATIEYNSDANVEVCAYDKNIGILSKNKFKIYNNYGKEENSLDMPINNVLFESCNRFLGVAENGGKKIYLISGQNIAWENEIEGSITKISVNRNGYMAVVISDTSYKTVVSLYNPSGKELFKIYLSSTRVADLSISDDNKYLALAEIDTSTSAIQSNVKIISIENAQTDTDNSIIYIYNAESNKLLINIEYQDKNKLICMYNDSIDKLYNEENTEIINVSDKKISYATIETNSNIAIVEEQASGLFTADSEVTLIETGSLKENKYTVHDVSKEIYSQGDIIGLNLGSEIHFINANGWLVKKYVAKQEISKVVLSESLAGIIYRDKIEIIDL